MSSMAASLATGRQRERRLIWMACGVTAVAVLATLLVGIRLSSPAVPSPLPAMRHPGALAIMPFQPITADPDTSHFGIGLADSMVNRLARVPGLTVRPMSATLALAGGITDPAEVGRRVGASAVMAGHFRQDGDHLEVTAQLVDVQTGFTSWGHSTETRLTDLAQVEHEVTEEALSVLLPGFDRTAQAPQPSSPGDPAAHHLYVLARGKMASLLSGVVLESVQLLEQAVARDPESAAAHAALAEASLNMFLAGHSADTLWIDRAVAAGRRAVRLDEQDPAAHLALGYALLFSGDPVGTMRETVRALQVDAEMPGAHRMLGMLLAGAGLSAPARAARQRAQALDPSMELGWLDVHIAIAAGTLSETTEALEREVERRAAAGLPAEIPVFNLGYLAFERDDAASGLHWAAMLENVSESPQYADIVRLLALARAGDGEGASRILQKHGSALQKDWEYSQWVGRALALLGRREEALEWLERSARMGCYQVHALEASDAVDGLRADPRFQRLLAQVRGRARAIVQQAEFAGYL